MDIDIPGTQMTLVFIGNGLLLEGSTPKAKGHWFQVDDMTEDAPKFLCCIV